MTGTYVHPADPSRDGEDWAGRRREAARDAHGNGVPHDMQLCGIPHRDAHPKKISETADPRVRIAEYGSRKFRTEVQEVPGGDWAASGPEYMTRADALEQVDETASRHFGAPTWDRERSLRAQVERLTAERGALQRKVYDEKRRNAALMVDGDRREQRALALLPDCAAHRTELQYLRHCVSWYWHNMTDSDQARQEVVTALMLTAQRLGGAGQDATVKAADVASWLRKAVDAQNKPLRRTSFPTLADCLRSAHGDCDHDGACGDVVAEVVAAFGLVLAEQPAPCKPAKARR